LLRIICKKFVVLKKLPLEPCIIKEILKRVHMIVSLGKGRVFDNGGHKLNE